MSPDASLWTQSADSLQRATASSDPTPGGGSVAAITAALGASLVVMALQITGGRHRRAGADDPVQQKLKDVESRGQQLIERLRAAADEDVTVFESLMQAYKLPREDEQQKAARREAVAEATDRATRAPLDLVEDCLGSLTVAEQAEPLVSDNVSSDVHAGADLLRGAAAAALRTADINLPSLPEDSPLIARRHELAARLRKADRAALDAADADARGSDDSSGSTTGQPQQGDQR